MIARIFSRDVAIILVASLIAWATINVFFRNDGLSDMNGSQVAEVTRSATINDSIVPTETIAVDPTQEQVVEEAVETVVEEVEEPTLAPTVEVDPTVEPTPEPTPEPTVAPTEEPVEVISTGQFATFGADGLPKMAQYTAVLGEGQAPIIFQSNEDGQAVFQMTGEVDLGGNGYGMLMVEPLVITDDGGLAVDDRYYSMTLFVLYDVERKAFNLATEQGVEGDFNSWHLTQRSDNSLTFKLRPVDSTDAYVNDLPYEFAASRVVNSCDDTECAYETMLTTPGIVPGGHAVTCRSDAVLRSDMWTSQSYRANDGLSVDINGHIMAKPRPELAHYTGSLCDIYDPNGALVSSWFVVDHCGNATPVHVNSETGGLEPIWL